jgi:hypothetical protein
MKTNNKTANKNIQYEALKRPETDNFATNCKQLAFVFGLIGITFAIALNNSNSASKEKADMYSNCQNNGGGDRVCGSIYQR